MNANEIRIRREKIMQLLTQKASMRVSELVTEFHLSDETIRKDLRVLADQGLITKSFGRAQVVQAEQLQPVNQRQAKHLEVKQAIAKRAVQLLPVKHAVIGLDQGSTVAMLANELNQVQNETIITSSLASLIMLQETNNELYSTGGRYSPSDMSFQGTDSNLIFQQVHLDYCFLGSSGVENRLGPCSSSFADAEMKRQMIKNSDVTVLLLEAAKFDKASLIQVADWSQIDYVVTDLPSNRPEFKTMSKATTVIQVKK